MKRVCGDISDLGDLVEREALPVDTAERPENDLSRAAETLGRLLAWITEARSPRGLAMRAYVVCWSIRPDLCPVRPSEFAEMAGSSLKSLDNLQRQFRNTFR